MDGYAIVKIDVADKELLDEFNSYIQRTTHDISFVENTTGYFRFSYNDRLSAASTAIVNFGNFLETNGFAINGMNSLCQNDGTASEVISFSKNGKETNVILSTLNVY